ncbi:MAG: YicC/YloC family endoribonuclease [Oscillospiraceae bacterium]
MIRSMTGYGRWQETLENRDILVEIRSVNNRYYDFSARIPRAYGYLEEKLKSLLQGSIARGKAEVSVSIYNIENKNELIEVDNVIAKGYIEALRKANEELGLADDITLAKITEFQDIFKITKVSENEDDVWNSVKKVADIAIEKFVEMREIEGLKTKEDFVKRLNSIYKMVETVESNASSVTENYRRKLFAKMKDVLSDSKIDEQRILLEAGIYSEKVAVDEETVRLKSHIQQFNELLEASEPIGRKLDFLVQEMNREANTIGSKSQDIDITRIVVDIKSEIEKIREQIQNIE